MGTTRFRLYLYSLKRYQYEDKTTYREIPPVFLQVNRQSSHKYRLLRCSTRRNCFQELFEWLDGEKIL